jgi:hypothetical protein
MKKISIALLALAAALAASSVARADSFTYTILGGNFSATLYLQATANDANGVATPGVDTITSVSGTFTDSKGTFTFTNLIPETANAGSDGTNLTTSLDGEFLFDNLLYPSGSGNGILDWGGLLFFDGSYELNLFSGARGAGAPPDQYFYFADNQSNHSNNRIPDPVYSSGPAKDESLVATPEPGSLFLLGTGLLGLALILFRKAGKQNSSGLVLGA